MGPVLDHPYDYLAHAVGGAVVVEVVEPKTIPGAFVLTLAIGYAKESLDKNVDHADALAWAIGGVMYQAYRVRVESKDGSLVLTKSWEF